jgi:hypothetical protein
MGRFRSSIGFYPAPRGAKPEAGAGRAGAFWNESRSRIATSETPVRMFPIGNILTVGR